MKRLPAAKTFRGTDGQYKYLHRWIGKTAGKPQYCEQAQYYSRKEAYVA